MPCVCVPQSYPSPGPPQLCTTLPAGSKAITVGVSPAPAWLFGRWMIHTLSTESVATPTTFPRSQSSGSGFGQYGSTWNPAVDAGAAPGIAGSAVASAGVAVSPPPQDARPSVSTIRPAQPAKLTALLRRVQQPAAGVTSSHMGIPFSDTQWTGDHSYAHSTPPTCLLSSISDRHAAHVPVVRCGSRDAPGRFSRLNSGTSGLSATARCYRVRYRLTTCADPRQTVVLSCTERSVASIRRRIEDVEAPTPQGARGEHSTPDGMVERRPLAGH